jgi:peptide/nickel transport system substrate-binding protein
MRVFSIGTAICLVICFATLLPQGTPVSIKSGYNSSETPANTIIWETIGNPAYLDPHTDYESFGSWISFNVYETLFTYPWMSADTTPSVPLLAESVDISEDGLNYTFHLREGITFQDGTPFNATCVQWNIERAMAIFDTFGPVWMLAEPLLGGQDVEDAAYGYGAGSPQHEGNYTAWETANHDGTGAIIVLDTYTVRMRLAYAYAPFIAALTYEVGAMMSPTWVDANGGITIGQHNTYVDQHTCGTGPYMVDEWLVDDHITLVENPNYWRDSAVDAAVAPLAHDGSINTIIIKTNEDVSSRILNLETGEDDSAYWPTSHANLIYNNVTGDSGDGTLKSKIPQLKLWAGEGTYDVMFLGFNMNPTINQTGSITQSPFTSINLRKALSYAFNYSVYIDQILNGFGLQLQGPIPFGMFGHNDSLYMYNYNMSAAVEYWNKAMLDDNLDLVWENNSYHLNIYYNSGNENRAKACLMMKDGIEAIMNDPEAEPTGSPLVIEVQPLEWASYLYQVQHRQLPIFFLGWAPDYADPDNYVGPFVKSTGTYPMRIGLGQSEGWDAETVDGWITSAAQSQNDTERIDLYGKIQDAIVDQVAFLWVYQAANFHVEYENVYGYAFNPMLDPYLYNYWKVSATSSTSSTSTTSTSTSTSSSSTTSETTSETTSSETTSTTSSSSVPTTGDMTLIYIAIGAGVVIVLLIVVVVMRRR